MHVLEQLTRQRLFFSDVLTAIIITPSKIRSYVEERFYLCLFFLQALPRIIWGASISADSQSKR